MIVFPIGVHTFDEPSTETGAATSTVHTMVDPSPETGTETSKPVIKKEPRIVGGLPAYMGQFPYQVLLLLTHQN
jgi:hypothetical protein